MNHINNEMKSKIKVASISGIIILLFYFGILNLTLILDFIVKLLGILNPFIFGFSLAFLLDPLCLHIRRKLRKIFNEKVAKNLSVTLTILIFIMAISLFFIVIIPQLMNSLSAIVVVINDGIVNIDDSIDYVSKIIGYDLSNLHEIVNKLGLSDILVNIIGYFGNYLPQIVEGGLKFVSSLFSMLIGIIICVYLLLDKERFYKQIKCTFFAFLPKDKVEYLVDITHLSSNMFKKFLIGKIIDSFIIGIMCYICMQLFGFDYPLLISFIIGMTNIIPVFGPFIGAIPSAIILFFVDPIETLWFLIFILALQQFDGNILGPYILGDSIGLPSFWVMFAIIVGGGMFGIIGMFLGIPLFAVIYFVIKATVYKRLEEKNIVV